MFESNYPQRKRNTFNYFFKSKKSWFFCGSIFIIVAILGISGKKVWSLTAQVYPQKPVGEILSSFGRLIIAGDKLMQGEREGEINILLLGVGGNGYYGKIVTDTIMVASLKFSSQDGKKAQASLVSIPRDLAAEVPSQQGLRKINEVYKFGELQSPGLGAVWIRQVAEELTGLQIPYYAVVDLEGFKKVIDAVGGVSINVERSFTDYSYPNYTLGYLPPVHFEKGFEHMNGERALQYSRSRHGTNGEASDFRRARRQQQMVLALKEKATALNLISHAGTILQLLEQQADEFQTNLEPWELKRLYDLARDLPQENVVTLTLNPATGLVCRGSAIPAPLYSLSICPGKTAQDVKEFIAERFNNQSVSVRGGS